MLRRQSLVAWIRLASGSRALHCVSRVPSLSRVSEHLVNHRVNDPVETFASANRISKRYLSSKKIEYEKAADETLESLCEHIEELIERDPKMAESDITLTSGVLTVKLPEPHGTFVINKQTPNQQIWLSSPQSGPARFDLVNSRSWVYRHTNESLHSLLNREIGKNILKLSDPGFETCYLGESC